ncbi:FbpB family small basic protein [Halobacillus litoralis]|nr:FbpB family small basic protein [Halobacillus litoralis]WLR47131.1 FbpB family small basic protein [Halobacillus litoralis]
MRSYKRISFEDLVDRNKRQLLNDQEAIEKIERQIDEKHTRKNDSDAYVN